MECEFNIDSYQELSIPNTPSDISKKLPFFVELTGKLCQGINYFTKRSGLNNYLIIFTVSGCGLLEYQGNTFNLLPNQICVIDCNEYHYYKTDGDTNWEFYYAHINGLGCKAYIDTAYINGFLPVTIEDDKIIVNYFQTIFDYLKTPSFYSDILISSVINSMLVDINISIINIPFKDKGRVKLLVFKAIEYIHQNYNIELHIKTLADLCYLSESHFIRVFKKFTGLTPYEYISYYRINKSKHLLINTTNTLEEICFSVGFKSSSRFIQKFKSIENVTPHNFRKKNL